MESASRRPVATHKIVVLIKGHQVAIAVGMELLRSSWGKGLDLYPFPQRLRPHRSRPHVDADAVAAVQEMVQHCNRPLGIRG